MILLSNLQDYKNLEPSFKNVLMDYLQFVIKNVPFYSKTLKQKDIEQISTEEFFHLPITYDQDLLENPLSFIPRNTKIVQLSSSGGTYDKRKIIFRTNGDIRRSIKTGVKMFLCGGLKSKDRIAILQPFDLWNIGHLALMIFRQIGVLSVPMGLSLSDKGILDFLKFIKCNVIYSTPSKASVLAELSKKRNQKLKIEKIFCAGEPILAIYRDTIKGIWGSEIYGIYGSEETDGIGAECEYHCGYHIFDDDLIIEILNPNTLMPANDNKGALVITKFNYKGTVLIRYLLGDLVEITTKTCQCGSKIPRIFPRGRVKEVIWLYDGRKITLSAFENTLEKVLGYVPEYQILVENNQKGSALLIKLKIKSDKVLREKLTKIFSRISQDLEEGINKGEIELSFQLDEKFTFELTDRGKIPKIIYRKINE